MSVNSAPINGVAINATPPAPGVGASPYLLLFLLLVMEPGSPPATNLTTLLRHRRKVKAAIARRYTP